MLFMSLNDLAPNGVTSDSEEHKRARLRSHRPDSVRERDETL